MPGYEHLAERGECGCCCDVGSTEPVFARILQDHRSSRGCEVIWRQGKTLGLSLPLGHPRRRMKTVENLPPWAASSCEIDSIHLLLVEGRTGIGARKAARPFSVILNSDFIDPPPRRSIQPFSTITPNVFGPVSATTVANLQLPGSNSWRATRSWTFGIDGFRRETFTLALSSAAPCHSLRSGTL